ncbi:MAG TPA: hypothetical protein VFJ15_04835 [Oleiagrimonas sp.]|nr:hypothetical protein [Oleiagrimonas sp.]
MGRHRTRIGWPYDPDREEFTLPDGRKLTLSAIAAQLYDEVQCRFDLTGPWRGWTIRQQYLKGPGKIRITPRTASMFWRWLDAMEQRDMASVKRNLGHTTVARYRHASMQHLHIGPVGNRDHCAANTPLMRTESPRRNVTRPCSHLAPLTTQLVVSRLSSHTGHVIVKTLDQLTHGTSRTPTVQFLITGIADNKHQSSADDAKRNF